MRIGWVEFNKEEERLVTQALLFGVFVGFTSGTLFYLVQILPMIPRQPPENTLELGRIIVWPFAILTIAGWFTSIPFACVRYIRSGERRSTVRLARIAGVLFFAFPTSSVYIALVFLLVILPFEGFLSQSLGRRTLFPIGLLLVFPFVVLFIAVVMPDSKPRRILNRSFKKLRRKMR